MEEEQEVLDDETTSEEESTEEPSEEEPSEESEAIQEYNFKIKGEDKTLSSQELEEALDVYANRKKWDTKLHKKGEQLNKLRDDLQKHEDELKGDKASLEEWKKLRKAIDANPQAYTLMNKLLNEAEPSVDPAIKKLEQEVADFRRETARKEAAIELSKEIEGFNAKEVQDFVGDFDLANPKDAQLFAWYAKEGSKMKDTVREARADVVRKAKEKKGLPATGKKDKLPSKAPKTLDEWAEMTIKQINSGAIKLE